MQDKLETMTKWLKDSGLVVNETMTEICLFYKAQHNPVYILLNNVTITGVSNTPHAARQIFFAAHRTLTIYAVCI